MAEQYHEQGRYYVIKFGTLLKWHLSDFNFHLRYNSYNTPEKVQFGFQRKKISLLPYF